MNKILIALIALTFLACKKEELSGYIPDETIVKDHFAIKAKSSGITLRVNIHGGNWRSEELNINDLVTFHMKDYSSIVIYCPDTGGCLFRTNGFDYTKTGVLGKNAEGFPEFFEDIL